MSNNDKVSESLYYSLIKDVNVALNKNKDGTEQSEQVESLIEFEKKFRESIWKFPKQCREIYKKFILLVLIENGNVLSARPYFRERSDIFNSKISPAIKNGDIESLKTYHFNFLLMKYLKDHWKGAFPEKSLKLYRKTEEARNKLIENNMPLAINRAKLFHRKSREAHLSLNDFIGMAADGLISGIDKYVGAYTKVFRSVCIGRMTGNMIEENNQSLIHFYPSDKMVLYRAKQFQSRNKIEDSKELLNAINGSLDEDKKEGRKIYRKKMDEKEFSNLMAASSIMSATMEREEDGKQYNFYDIMSVEPDPSVENKQALSTMLKCARSLSVVEIKILKLKGIKL